MFPALLVVTLKTKRQAVGAGLPFRTHIYLSGTKGLPSDAGVFIIVRRLLREMMTRTTMVAM
jgi:hypothetical protein